MERNGRRELIRTINRILKTFNPIDYVEHLNFVYNKAVGAHISKDKNLASVIKDAPDFMIWKSNVGRTICCAARYLPNCHFCVYVAIPPDHPWVIAIKKFNEKHGLSDNHTPADIIEAGDIAVAKAAYKLLRQLVPPEKAGRSITCVTKNFPVEGVSNVICEALEVDPLLESSTDRDDSWWWAATSMLDKIVNAMGIDMETLSEALEDVVEAMKLTPENSDPINVIKATEQLAKYAYSVFPRETSQQWFNRRTYKRICYALSSKR